MATRLVRPRIRPMWKGSLRRGKERHSMAVYLATHPELARKLRGALEEIRARGYRAMSMEGIKQPFDYEPRHLVS